MIKIAIATNKNFYELTLPVVIDSLLAVGIEKSDIHVFNAGFDEPRVDIVDDITHHFLNHNSYEYSPLIDIVENQIESEYWFLIHDTCKVGPDFKKLLYNIPPDKPEKIALKHFPAMSIGTYKYSYLLSVRDKLLGIKNTDYSFDSMQNWKKWGVPNEDYILWQTLPQPQVYPGINGVSQYTVTDHENWYNTGTARRTEYYQPLDIYKNKSNWGQTTNTSRMVIDL